jgi:polar amino acid transport system permease protein
MARMLLNLFVLLGDGVKYTVGLFVITTVLSLPLGLVLTYCKNSRIPLVRVITGGYVYFMRGTPLLLQLFFVYYGLPFLPYSPVVLDRFTAACVAFTLNYAAYYCEIFRGGLIAIDKGQYEAAKVLGLSNRSTLVRIVLPQMLRVSLPAIANECIVLIKDTALVTAIGVTEIIYYAKASVNRMANFSAYPVAACYYLFFNYIMTKLFDWLENKFSY